MNLKRMTALCTAATLLLSGCGSSEAAETTASGVEEAKASATIETTAATESAPASSAEEESTEAVSVNYSAGLAADGQLLNPELAELVTLPDLSKIVLSADEVAVTDEEVEEEIASILSDYTTTVQVTDRETMMGDTVNIDYVGTIDGVAFDGGNTNGYGADLILGSYSYIDDFEEQLAGHMPGETVKVEVTFPENYGAAELAGKDAVFTTTINYIKEEGTPELTDEFVAENLKDTYGTTTVDSFRLTVRDYLETDKKYTALWNWLSAETEFSGEPKELSEDILQNYVDLYKLYASNYGFSLDEYLSYFGLSGEDDLRDNYREEAETAARRYVITQAIGDQENIVVDDEVLDEYFKGQDYSDLIDYYGEGYVRMQVKFTKLYEKLLENTVFE